MDQMKKVPFVKIPIEEFLAAADNDLNRSLESDRVLYVESAYLRELGVAVDDSVPDWKLSPVPVTKFFDAVDSFSAPKKKKASKKSEVEKEAGNEESA